MSVNMKLAYQGVGSIVLKFYDSLGHEFESPNQYFVVTSNGFHPINYLMV